jgi:enamine deaminase RidA (YjgF/YER057c/UK114 family)
MCIVTTHSLPTHAHIHALTISPLTPTPPPYTHTHTCIFAGQVPDAEAAGKDATTQTKSVLDQVDALLTRAGTDKTKLLSATVYLTSMEHYAGMNAAWEAWVPAGSAPARATVGNVTLARPEWCVEIVIVAAQ